MRRRKNGRIEWRFYVSTPTGRKQVSAYGKGITELKSERDRVEELYKLAPKQRVTLGDILARYIANKWKDQSIDRRKICEMQSRFERLVPNELKRQTVATLCADWSIIGDLFSDLAEERPNSYVVQRTFDEMKRAFKYARARGWCKVSPMVYLERPKYRQTKKRKPFTVEQVLDLLLKSSGRDRVMIAFLVMTAVRTWSELSGLRVRDLNLLRKTVNLTTFVRRTEKGCPTEKPPIPGKPKGKNEAAEREIPLIDPLITMLEDYITSARLRADDYLFPNKIGGLLRAGNWSRDVWKPLVKSVGRPDGVPYELRHTANSLLAELGVGAEQRAAICGHSEDVNKLIYTHMSLEVHRAAMNKLGLLFPDLTALSNRGKQVEGSGGAA